MGQLVGGNYIKKKLQQIVGEQEFIYHIIIDWFVNRWIILDHTHAFDLDQLRTSGNIPDMRCDGLCLHCGSCRKTSNTFDRVTLASQKCLNVFAWIRSFSLPEFCSCNVWYSILELIRSNTKPLPELPALWSCHKGVIGGLKYVWSCGTRKISDLKAQLVWGTWIELT